jgi:two-component system chemotaxis response regulator CheB
MAGHDVIVVGASAGGVSVLAQMARGLPPGLPAAIFVVCHFPPGGQSVLPDILSGAGPLLAVHAQDGQTIYPGHIYIAPPDRHLLLQPGRMHLSREARENMFRPAIDPLFRSAARVFGPRVIGVVLTGALHDGVAGLMAVRTAGGIAVVQNPKDASVPALPQTAEEVAGSDYVVAGAALAPLLIELVHRQVRVTGGPTMVDPLDQLPKVVDRDMEAQERGERRGHVSVYTCPECGGALWQADEEHLIQFRCHVGHSYYGEALLAEQSTTLEVALWTAIRTFRERSVLGRQLAVQERQRGKAEVAERFEEEARLAERYGQAIREYFFEKKARSASRFAPAPAAPPDDGLERKSKEKSLRE